MALPAFGALVAEPLYVLGDTAVVGRLGTPELAGLAVASSALLLLYSVFIFLAYGTTAAVSRLLGAGDEREAAHQAVQSLWLALGLGLAVSVVGLVVAPSVVELLGARAGTATATQALIYLRISLTGVPAMLMVLAGTGYLRGLQDTRTPLMIAVGTAGLNLLLEMLLIFGLGYGIGASALSTVVAQVGAASIYLGKIAGTARRHQVGLRPDAGSLLALARVGVDLLIRTAALRGALTVATAVAARMGTVEVAGYQIAWEVWGFLAYTLDAVAIAGQALVGRALGAGDEAAARGAGWRMIEWGVTLGVVLGSLVVVVRWLLPGVFTHDPAVAELAAFSLLWVGLTQPVNAVAFVLDGVLIGAGDQRFLARSMLAVAAGFLVMAVGIVQLGLGLGWLWAALAVFMLGRAVTLLVRFLQGGWIVLGTPAPR